VDAAERPGRHARRGAGYIAGRGCLDLLACTQTVSPDSLREGTPAPDAPLPKTEDGCDERQYVALRPPIKCVKGTLYSAASFTDFCRMSTGRIGVTVVSVVLSELDIVLCKFFVKHKIVPRLPTGIGVSG
jgi:hypothetical protein